MLEEKKYGVGELQKMFHCSDKQGLDRKLMSYSIDFESTGRGRNRVYDIKYIADPFKVYCILKLGIPAQADFSKIRNLYYYYFCWEDFAEKPLIEQEAIMEQEGVPVARKTITKWLNYLEEINYISLDRQNCRYYIISKAPNGKRNYTETDRATYNKGWRIYFTYKNEEGCGPAYSRMYNLIGGHPYKKPRADQNGILKADIDELIDAINGSFLNINV